MAAQYVLQLVLRQGRDGPVVRTRHSAGGDQCIDDRLLDALHRGFEQRVEGCGRSIFSLSKLEDFDRVQKTATSDQDLFDRMTALYRIG